MEAIELLDRMEARTRIMLKELREQYTLMYIELHKEDD